LYGSTHIYGSRVWTYADLTQAPKALEFESRFCALVFASKQVSIIFDIIKICFFRSFDLWHCNITAPRARGRPGLGRFSPNKSKLLPLFSRYNSANNFFPKIIFSTPTFELFCAISAIWQQYSLGLFVQAISNLAQTCHEVHRIWKNNSF
jgi:hypothetical protein